jgi:uncharacterized damage-inducible protein DinB
MQITTQIAQHFRGIYFGKNWTSVNMQEILSGIDYKQATTSIANCNTIAALVYHTNYYVSAVLKVLQGETLNAHDKFSFDVPTIKSETEWEQLKEKSFNEATQFAALIEQIPDEQLLNVFSQEKYGNYYRNLHGIIEHTHYHVGQIAIIKKLLTTPNLIA